MDNIPDAPPYFATNVKPRLSCPDLSLLSPLHPLSRWCILLSPVLCKSKMRRPKFVMRRVHRIKNNYSGRKLCWKNKSPLTKYRKSERRVLFCSQFIACVTMMKSLAFRKGFNASLKQKMWPETLAAAISLSASCSRACVSRRPDTTYCAPRYYVDLGNITRYVL